MIQLNFGSKQTVGKFRERIREKRHLRGLRYRRSTAVGYRLNGVAACGIYADALTRGTKPSESNEKRS